MIARLGVVCNAFYESSDIVIILCKVTKQFKNVSKFVCPGQEYVYEYVPILSQFPAAYGDRWGDV